MGQSGSARGDKNSKRYEAIVTAGGVLLLACLVTAGWYSYQPTVEVTSRPSRDRDIATQKQADLPKPEKKSRGAQLVGSGASRVLRFTQQDGAHIDIPYPEPGTSPIEQTTPMPSDYVRVSGEAGKGRWPLKGISEGTILCRWHEFIPGSRNPITRRPLVLFESPNGKLYAVNGAAESAAAKGYITAKSLEEIRVGSIDVASKWLDAGLALCMGDNETARRLATEANRIAALEPEFPDVWAGKEEAEGKRIYLELNQCWVESTRAARKADGSIDLAKETELDRACGARTGLTEDERILLIQVGIARSWPSQ